MTFCLYDLSSTSPLDRNMSDFYRQRLQHLLGETKQNYSTERRVCIKMKLKHR